MIEAHALVYDYPGLRALDHVGFAVATGSITALVGPNGAGKSTLLRCLSALDQPHEGHVLIDGRDIHDDPRGSHRMIGYLPDSFGLYTGLTVEQCLRHRAGTHGIRGPTQKAAAEAVAERVGATVLLGRRTETLSRGQRQRVAIAEAMIHGPKLLLLDEPASGLDPEARGDLSGMLRVIATDGVTVIVSSHILSELEDYSTHVLMLEAGRVIAHHAIDAPDTAGIIVRIELATADERLANICAAILGADPIDATAARARVRVVAETEARATLLRGLVEAGLAVSHFAPEEADLQRLYIETLRRDREARA